MSAPAVDRLTELLEILHFDLHGHLRAGRAGRRDRLRNRARRHDVVLLDQDSVEEPDAVIPAAADAHRIFLRRAQPREGLAGIEQPASRALDPLGVGMGGGRRAGQKLQEIERRPFSGQERPGRPRRWNSTSSAGVRAPSLVRHSIRTRGSRRPNTAST